MPNLNKTSQPGRGSFSRRLRVGFVPLTDCAPLLVAQELGLFKRHGLDVILSRELGWATVRDKIIYGELHAAHALAPMVFQLALGLGCNPCPCCTPLVLSSQGNAITISRRLWNAGLRDAAGLQAWHQANRRTEPLIFGIVFPYSYHHLLLRDWFAAAGLNLERDVKLVVVPPPQMVLNLKAGHLDGFCVGEPWGALAEETGAGCCVARSATLAPLHPEKVLLVRDEVLRERREDTLALTAAMLEACDYCADSANAEALATLLAHPRYLGVSRAAILAAFAPGKDGQRRLLFGGGDLNDPSLDKAGILARRLRYAGLLEAMPKPAQLGELFRTDLFQLVTQTKTQPDEIALES